MLYKAFFLVGVLLLKRHTLGYLLSACTVILGMTVGLSVEAGERMLGLSTGRMNAGGIAVFAVFLSVALAPPARVPASMRDTSLLAQ